MTGTVQLWDRPVNNLSRVIRRDINDRRAPPAVQDRAERMATATIQIICAKPKTTTTELRSQLVEMYRDEIADIERQRAREVRLQDE